MKNTKLFSMYLMVFFISLAWSMQAQEPNILVIVADDQGYEDINIKVGTYRSKNESYVRTPGLQKLANSSYFFTNAYTSGNICAPTRAGLMTGNYQQQNGIFSGGSGDIGVRKTVKFMPNFLPSSYAKAAFGKWHAGEKLGKQDPVTKGFDEYLGYFAKGGHEYFKMTKSEHDKNEDKNFAMLNQLNGKVNKIADIDDSDFFGLSQIERYDEGLYMTNLLSSLALDFIDRQVKAKKPFLCYLSFTALHSPSQAPEIEKRYVRGYFKKSHAGKFRSKYEDRVTLMAMLKVLDDGVNDIVSYLKEAEVFDNTLIIYLSDNGGDEGMQADNGSLKGFKQTCYQGGIKTPFLISWPKGLGKGNKAINTPIMSFDVLPTLIEASGGKRVNLDGQSLIPIINDNEETKHETMYWSEGGEKFEDFLRGKEKPKGEFAIIDNNSGDKIFSEVSYNGKKAGKYSNVKIGLFKTNINTDSSERKYKPADTELNSTDYNMLKDYEIWLSKKPNPIKKKTNVKSFYVPNSGRSIVTVYDDIYYNGKSTAYTKTGKIRPGSVRSIVVSRGYVATVSNGSKSITVKEGVPLFIDAGFDGNIALIDVKKTSKNARLAKVSTLESDDDDDNTLVKSQSNGKASQLKVWNSTSEKFVSIECSSRIKAFTVFDMSGNPLITEDGLDTNSYGFYNDELPAGVYLVKVVTVSGEVLKAKKLTI